MMLPHPTCLGVWAAMHSQLGNQFPSLPGKRREEKLRELREWVELEIAKEMLAT